jgi:tetratricopeptide (TPR) repeat protein
MLIRKLFFYSFLLLIAGGVSFFAWFYTADSDLKANFYYKKAAHYEQEGGEAITAIRAYKKSIRLYETLGNKEKAVTGYIKLALLHYNLGNILQVEYATLRALNIGKETVPEHLQVHLYLLLASTSEPKKAKEYIQLALDMATRLKLRPEIAKSYYLRGRIDEIKANFRSAERHYLKAIGIIERFPSTLYFVETVDLYERLGELYAGEGRTRSAIKYYDKALAFSYREGDTLEVARFMQMLGDLYRERREYAKACEFWKKSQEEYALLGHGKSINEKYFDIPKTCHKIS